MNAGGMTGSSLRTGKEEIRLSENIVNILESIKEVKGQEYVEGLVDMANLLAPRKTDEAKDQPG